MTPARRQRMWWLITLIVGASLAVGLVLHALSKNIDLYLTPSQVLKQHLSTKQIFRLGGFVLKGTVHRGEGLNIEFALGDFYHKIEVHYDGVLPSLFRVGQGLIVEGHLMANGDFQATQVLAKHNADYHPPEIPTDAKYK